MKAFNGFLLKHPLWTLSIVLLLTACTPNEEGIEETIRKANVQLENGQEQDAIGLLESLNARLPGNAAILEALVLDEVLRR